MGHALNRSGLDPDQLVLEITETALMRDAETAADVLGVPVIRPQVTETTALGAAYAAGLATGFWSGQDELCERWAEDKRWLPEQDREEEYARWKKAVQRSLDWVES